MMKKILIYAFCTSLLSGCSPGEPAAKPDPFVPLFNGANFEGWQGATDQYEIVDETIISKGGGVLFTTAEYSDFILRFEFKLPPGGNNGLAIRYPGQGDPAYVGMCELQILDNTAPQYADLDPRQYHGSIYGKVAATRGHLRPVGEWNFQEVWVSGSHVRVELNRIVILDADQAKVTEFMNGKMKNEIPESGYLGLAGHGKGVAFRNLRIKAL